MHSLKNHLNQSSSLRFSSHLNRSYPSKSYCNPIRIHLTSNRCSPNARNNLFVEPIHKNNFRFAIQKQFFHHYCHDFKNNIPHKRKNFITRGCSGMIVNPNMGSRVRWFYGESRISDKPSNDPSNLKKTKLELYYQLLRMDKPIGYWLLFWPCAWSVAMATPFGTLPSIYHLSLFFVGSVAMRGAGCVVNDIWDRKLDSLVERTRDRPLASGQVRVREAVGLFFGVSLIGLSVLLQFNNFSIGLGLLSIPLFCLYPAAKRVMSVPQLVLGVTFNWGILMGWAAQFASIDWNIILPLYLASISWTLYYDTIYAHQDKKDDALVGIKSSALTFGEKHAKKFLSGFASVFVAGLALSASQLGLGYGFYLGLSVIAFNLAKAIKELDLNDPKDCFEKFKSNHLQIGATNFAAILAGLYTPQITSIISSISL